MKEINALGPLDGRYANRVEELREIFSECGLIKRRVRVEVAWLLALCGASDIPEARALSGHETSILKSLVRRFDEEDAERVKEFEKTTNHDVKAVEYYLKEKMCGAGLDDVTEFVHFGCTSEDINNLAHALMLSDGLGCIAKVQDELIAALCRMAIEYKRIPMMARTHGQPASPTTVGKELAVFAERLRRQCEDVARVPILGKMNGAVGNFNAHVAAYPEVNWVELARAVVEDELGLVQNMLTTQIEPHDYMAEIFDGLSRWNSILLDFDRDVWTYISLGYFAQRKVEGEVGSSTMPHKVNPIDFENSEGNLGLANALFRHLSAKLPVSRLQRDLTDSTVLRNMGVAFGYSLVACRSTLKGISKLTLNESVISADLDEAWELLAEPIQTVMRKAGMKNPYEKLKELTRGSTVTRETITSFIEGLDLSEEERTRLLELTPGTYVGLASDLVDRMRSARTRAISDANADV